MNSEKPKEPVKQNSNVSRTFYTNKALTLEEQIEIKSKIDSRVKEIDINA